MFDDSVVLDVLAYKPEPDKLRFEVPTGTNHFETSFGSGWVTALTQANLSDYATTFVLALPVIDGVLSVAVDPEGFTIGFSTGADIFGPASAALKHSYEVPTIFSFPRPKFAR